MVTPDAWLVEPVVVHVSLVRPDRQMLRVKRRP
jgi:hypothetical protein